MVKSSPFISYFDVWNLTPSLNNQVVILVVINRDGVMNNVSDFINFRVNLYQESSLGLFDLFLSLFIFGFDFKLLFAFVLFADFFLAFDFVLVFVPFFFKHIEVESHFSPFLIHLDNHIAYLWVSVSSLKRLSDDTGVITLVFSEPIDI